METFTVLEHIFLTVEKFLIPIRNSELHLILLDLNNIAHERKTIREIMTQGFRALGELNDSVLFWKLTHFRFIKRTIILSRAKIVKQCLKGVAFSPRFWKIDDSLPSRQSFWSPGWVKMRSTDTLTSTTKELQDLLRLYCSKDTRLPNRQYLWGPVKVMRMSTERSMRSSRPQNCKTF